MSNHKFFTEIESITGNEGYKEIFSSVSTKSMSGVKFIADKTATQFNTLFDKASRELILAVGNNKTKIEKAERDVKEHKGATFFSEKALQRLSSTGNASSLVKDAKTLNESLNAVKDALLDIQALNEKKLGLFERYRKIKTVGDATKILQSLDELDFPVPKFPHKNNGLLTTNILPQGKMFEYSMSAHHYDIVSFNHDDNDNADDNALNNADTLALLQETKKLESIYRTIAKANQNYSAYLKKFNTMIKSAFDYLDKTELSLSSSVKRDLLTRLEGDKKVFGFYTGFLPKTVNYVDEYIDTLTSYLISKRTH